MSAGGKQSSKPPNKKAFVNTSSTPTSNKRERTPSTPESSEGAVAQSASQLTTDDIAKMVDSAMQVAMEAARSKLRDDMTVLIHAKVQGIESSMDELRRECDVRDESIRGIEHDNRVLAADVNSLKEHVADLKRTVDQLRITNDKLEKRCNDIEQWTRKTAVRVFGVPRKPREDCIQLVYEVIKNKLQISDLPASTIEVAHRVGPSRNGRPAAIIAKFLRRDDRDRVLRARSVLKGSGITISEDLTADNQRLLAKVRDHTDIESCWSWNGKIFGKVRANMKIVQFKVGDNITQVIEESLRDSRGEQNVR